MQNILKILKSLDFFVGSLYYIIVRVEVLSMESKKQNFKRISENRVSKIIILLNQLTNLTNTSFYEYSDEDIEKIFKEIEQATNNSKKILLNRKNNKRIEL